MASSKEYLDFILDQLSGLDGISYRAMMGEYIKDEEATEKYRADREKK